MPRKIARILALVVTAIAASMAVGTFVVDYFLIQLPVSSTHGFFVNTIIWSGVFFAGLIALMCLTSKPVSTTARCCRLGLLLLLLPIGIGGIWLGVKAYETHSKAVEPSDLRGYETHLQAMESSDGQGSESRREASVRKELPRSEQPKRLEPEEPEEEAVKSVLEKYAYNRGVTNAKKGEYDKAVADFTEAIRLDPKTPDAYFARGVAYSNKREHAKAEADFAKVKELEYDAE